MFIFYKFLFFIELHIIQNILMIMQNIYQNLYFD